MMENIVKDHLVILNLLFDFRNWKLLWNVHKEFSKDKNHSFWNLFRVIWYVSKDEKIIKYNGKYVITSFFPPIPSKAFDQLFNSVNKNVSSFYGHTHAMSTSPISIHIAVTNKCNFNCWHCSNVNRKKKDGITTKQMIKLIKDLQDMGVAIIGLTGGEPLLRKDIEKIVSSIDDRSISILFTTGQTLTLEKAKKLKKAGLFMAGISLDHYEKDYVDKKRGYKGAFETALNAVKNCKKAGLYTMIQIVVRKDLFDNNCEKIWKMLDFAKRIGVHEIRLLEPICTGRLIHAAGSILLTDKEREKLREIHKKANWSGRYPKVSTFAQIESKEMFGCGAGSQHSYIDAQGNLYPCDFVPLSFGNIKEESIKRLWAEMNKTLGKPCVKCFMLQNVGKIRKIYKGKLPLNKKETKKICKSCYSKELPDFYKVLAGKR